MTAVTPLWEDALLGLACTVARLTVAIIRLEHLWDDGQGRVALVEIGASLLSLATHCRALVGHPADAVAHGGARRARRARRAHAVGGSSAVIDAASAVLLLYAEPAAAALQGRLRRDGTAADGHADRAGGGAARLVLERVLRGARRVGRRGARRVPEPGGLNEQLVLAASVARRRQQGDERTRRRTRSCLDADGVRAGAHAGRETARTNRARAAFVDVLAGKTAAAPS